MSNKLVLDNIVAFLYPVDIIYLENEIIITFCVCACVSGPICSVLELVIKLFAFLALSRSVDTQGLLW